MIEIKDRVILHVDGDAFFASVEETLHPELKKVPMAVCGNPKSRSGIILAKNQLAKECGVKTAETIWQAKDKCPNLVLAPGRHPLYREFCTKLNNIYIQYTDQVEQLSIDESFLDVTGSLHLFDTSGEELAHEIRKRVNMELGITVSVGVSFNKIFAKMASDINKPNNVTVISKENFKDILWNMPVEKLYTVGAATAKSLRNLYLKTIGDIASADTDMLTAKLGKSGMQLHNYANGFDDTPVLRAEEAGDIHSVGNGRTFKRNLVSLEDIKVAITALSDTVSSRMRNKHIKCLTVQVMIKDPKFKVITRQKGVSATWLASDISRASLDLIKSSWKIGEPIRMITITASNLVPEDEAVEQLSFFSSNANPIKMKKQEELEKTIFNIRNKFGTESISHGSIVQNDLGINDKYLEDDIE